MPAGSQSPHSTVITRVLVTVIAGSRSAAGEEALGAGADSLQGLGLPPALGREDLDLYGPAVAGGLDQAPEALQVDGTIAHHAAVEQQVAGRDQPVADLVA